MHLSPSKRRLSVKEFLEESFICAALVSHVSVISVPSCYTWTNTELFLAFVIILYIFYLFSTRIHTRRMHCNVRLRLLSPCLQVYNYINKCQDLCVCVCVCLSVYRTYGSEIWYIRLITSPRMRAHALRSQIICWWVYRSSVRLYVLLLLLLDLRISPPSNTIYESPTQTKVTYPYTPAIKCRFFSNDACSDALYV